MCRRILTGLIIVFGLVFAQSVSAGSSKVQVCHIPPDDPGNFHTITISEKALDAHLTHGDLSGPCDESGELLCDDGNACTVDAIDPETGTCMAEHPPVDCIDGLLCSTDSCDPAVGCQYAPIVCDDADLCTVDQCSEFDGQCTSTPIDCGPLGTCLADGQCDWPCDGITCEPVDQCHVAGQCVLPGECNEGVEVDDGTPCDDGDVGTTGDQCVGGSCTGTEIGGTCPCFTYDDVVYAVSRLTPWDNRNECLKNGEQGEAVNTRRITWFDNSDPNLNMGLGESLQAAILIDRFNCFYTDWEDGTDTGILPGTYEEILDCTRIMDQAYTDTAGSDVLASCVNW